MTNPEQSRFPQFICLQPYGKECAEFENMFEVLWFVFWVCLTASRVPIKSHLGEACIHMQSLLATGNHH